MSFLAITPFWGWLGLALALIAVEALAAPGTYLLWVGLAAGAMALLSTMVTITGAAELTVFGLFSLGFGLVGWKVYGARAHEDAARDLHDLAYTYVGREVLITTAISNGIGQARLDDTFWRVSGPDLPAGTRVKIRAVDGATLIVDAV